LKHRYGTGDVTLNIPSLSIEEGDVMGVVGTNGSGKSTFLKILAFLEPISEGSILYKGNKSSGIETELREEITYLLQEPYLLKRTIFENIAYGLKLRGKNFNVKERVCDSLLRVGLNPDNFINRPWYRLSGGEAQRVALAMRLALRPKVLLLDEPTANVDEQSAQLVKAAALSAWKEWGTTVIIATHDLTWLHEVSTVIVTLYKGRIVGKEAENIIQGSWEINGDFAVRNFSDGQIIRGFCCETENILAGSISPSKIKITTVEQPRSDSLNIIKGTVVQTTLDSKKESVYVFVKVGESMIKVLMPLGQMQKDKIYPSTQVWISFSPNNLNWLY